MVGMPTTTPRPPLVRGTSAPTTSGWFWVAGVLGTLHALPSAYWAAGGTRLLDTVGTAAVELAREAPWWVTPMLLLVTLAKLAGAWIPLLAQTGCVPGIRWWRPLSWLGGAGLMAYGASNIVASTLVLTDAFVPSDEVDRTGLLGHALVWGPLFLLWGAALLTALWRTHAEPRTEVTAP